MKRILLTMFVTAFLFSACASAPATSLPTEAPIPSTLPALTDPSQPITVKAGDTFMIVMESNPSTGYHWEMIGPLDDAHLELVSREYTASEPVMPGSGGVEVWTLKAVSAGETVLVLGNYPPAQGESYTTETRFSILIQ